MRDELGGGGEVEEEMRRDEFVVQDYIGDLKKRCLSKRKINVEMTLMWLELGAKV